MLNNIKEYISTLQYGIGTFIFEILIILLALGTVICILFKFVNSKKLIIIYLGLVVLSVIGYLLGSILSSVIISILIVFLTIGMFVFYIPEVKQYSKGKIVAKQSKKYLTTNEVKLQLIEELLKAVKHLSGRRIGAIITIEREHSLNTLVEGSVKMDALVSFELLETIFHPNTALHDGAVIIRGDRIKCSSAFYQPSQKKDIPQHYGSRHRAAIGISEQSDAFTIVVSEETGHVATTIGGTITGNVSLEGLKLSLEQHIIVKNN